MQSSTSVGITVAATVAVAAASLALLIRSRRDLGPPHAWRLLLLATPVSAALAGAASLAPALEDSGSGFAAAFTVTPLLASVVPLAVSRLRRLGPPLTWAAALAMLTFVTLFGAGLGLFYLPTAVLTLATAAHSGASRSRRSEKRAAGQGS